MLRVIKNIAKNNRLIAPYYERVKNYYKDRPLYGKYTYENRSNSNYRLCIVLAGYKEYLYPAVFGRLAQFAPKDMDVCICSSGLYSAVLSQMCKEHNWSYLSTKKNNVSLVQNIAICLHPQADYIYKLDEDIFITKDYFDHMIDAYMHACKSYYYPGVIAPLIPVNGYGYMRILDKLNLLVTYESLFESPKYASNSERKIENDSSVARFFWGEGGQIPSIDNMNESFSKNSHEERPCPIRFSIGAILFRREVWEKMGYFPVKSGSGLGADERHLCSYCCIASRPVMVSENIVVGHFSFSKQNEEMKNYYLANKSFFMV